jgi:hypothetical protein
VRDLAVNADPFVKRRLLRLAQHYEQRISISRGVTGTPVDSQSAASISDDEVDSPPK